MLKRYSDNERGKPLQGFDWLFISAILKGLTSSWLFIGTSGVIMTCGGRKPAETKYLRPSRISLSFVEKKIRMLSIDFQLHLCLINL